jgi:predicted AlkP superfamily pyrophosphatase or phosphodiesterase
MPRIKAVTTGSIPSFLDVILNFAESDTTSTLASQDTWLAQMKDKWKSKWAHKLIMYGDDTWIKLFPGTFHRSDGTSSFFVSVSQISVALNTIMAEYVLVGLYGSGQQCDQACPRRIE